MMIHLFFSKQAPAMIAKLYIGNSNGRGRGVFSKKYLEKGETIEVCPLLVIPAIDTDLVKASGLIDYFFNFDKEENTIALALGFGSLYNHVTCSNAAYKMDKENKSLRFYALENIKPGTEITINYGGESGIVFNEWFESRNILIT